ncbi:MAG TPA: GAF domain-containing protein [Ktedonobacteraceae bacterium]|jgi:GAF domain-containing protein|nr:GAF domain-containing protein [Ktedonobacteraceae bacterium]
MSSKASTNHQLPSCDPTPGVLSSDQQHEEIIKLRNELELRTRENAVLNEVISTVGSTLRLDEVLRHLVDTVVRATSCEVAFIYLYDKDKEKLILANTSETYQHLVGKITMGLGEGIAGWAALHRKAVILKDEAMEDPRFCYFPELEEEKYQSIMTVPIIGKDRLLIGAITLQAVAPHEFTEQHRIFISNTASLVAGAIENAQLYENTQRKLSILTTLSVLSQTISSGLYLDDMLRSLATLTVQIMEIDLCVIMLMDQARERELESPRQPRRLTVHATSPNLNDRVHFQTIDVDRHTLERLRENNELSIHTIGTRAMQGQGAISFQEESLERLNPLKDSQYKSLISAPLIAGAEQLGLINCYASRARRFTPEDQTLLTTIANQAAIAIKNSHLVNQLAQKNLVKGFFEDLMHGTSDSEDSLRQRAHFLGCDLTRLHTVVVVEIAHVDERRNDAIARPAKEERPGTKASVVADESSITQGAALQATYKRISGVVRRRIQDSYPGSVFDEHENLLTCIIALNKDTVGLRLKAWLQELSTQMRTEYMVSLSIGIGNACQHISDYRRGFAEANEALQMGQNLAQDRSPEAKRQPIVTHFNDLGVYRYLYKIARMDDLRDVYQDQIARIDSYDRRKNTDLLDTLETYLECAGNLTKTSERLFVHRNTLIQRLERLQSLCNIDLQERANWLTLQVAIKVYKLRTGE